MVVHVNTYGHMQLELPIMEAIIVVTAHVLPFQDQPLPPLLAIITTVNLEQEVALAMMHITSPTHCGMVQVALLIIHVAPTLTNHGSIVS